MLTLNGFSCAYENENIIENVSFSLDCGLHILLGPNGSGKTTLFRALLGLLPHCTGTAELEGRDILSLSPKKRARLISAVLGSHNTPAGITGQNFAEMSLYSKSGIFLRPSAEDRERIRTLAVKMGIVHLLDASLDKMSTGERQMISLLTAEVQDTPLMLLDEPTGSLDYTNARKFMERAKEISEGKILLCTLHNPSQALRYADSILLIKDGQLTDVFSPDKTDPGTAEVLLGRIYPGIHIFSAEKGLYAE